MAQLPTIPSQIVDPQEIELTHNALERAPDLLAQAATHLAAERAEMVTLRAEELWQAKSDLDLAENSATMAAYGGGVVSGKNQAERDVQLTDYLAKDVGVATARGALRGVELRVAACEAAIEQAEADYKVAWARLSAARASAALQTAYLQLLATGEAETETENADLRTATAELFGNGF